MGDRRKDGRGCGHSDGNQNTTPKGTSIRSPLYIVGLAGRTTNLNCLYGLPTLGPDLAMAMAQEQKSNLRLFSTYRPVPTDSHGWRSAKCSLWRSYPENHTDSSAVLFQML